MKIKKLVTNNPRVIEEVKNGELGSDLNLVIEKCNDLDEVMTRSRDLIHKGYKLLTHPLAGSVKPAQNPYRSIILAESEKDLDYFSLNIMEKALDKLRQFQKTKKDIEYPESILEDYQLIDHSLISSGIESL